ncbi:MULTISPECIES: class I SAM-dependent methyltransferase [unclassified Sedimentibacter]|uniref:class I SAM-dependent methyltransferase n=1 Tax=unclassified Sedimentibacter TaxID=2649220 RepID=UPI0027E1078D|nr:class I SAM-dependent methyltransferase [Sedimentibacter sp. MB35-C1]WMJ77278.1 class I SAM-dependent methyltransferase [Sedimentibacter sp. MB35-C1]
MAIFDNSASDYDAWYTDKKGSFVDKVETGLAFEMMEIKKGMKILDVGCGTGNFSVKLAKKGCSVTGIDVSDEMLSIARKKASDLNLDIELMNMDVNNLSFDDNTFDGVISMTAFEFIEDAPKALKELLRVVKKGGQVLIGTIAGESSWSELYLSEPFRENTVFKYAKFRTVEEIKDWNREKLVDTGECLFVSPLAEDCDYNDETEKNLSKTTNGGFVCALWKK